MKRRLAAPLGGSEPLSTNAAAAIHNGGSALLPVLADHSATTHATASLSPLRNSRHKTSTSMATMASDACCTLAVFVVLLTIVSQLRLWMMQNGIQSPSPSFYIPTLHPSDYFEKEQWDFGPFIHIVKTRFMQEQGNLTALGQARLALFRVFCLSTMTHQSTQQFLWIIRVDPHLHPTLILEPLIQLVQPYDNIYLVASNVNFRVNENFPGAWRDGAEARNLVHSQVYTGNRTRLELAMALEPHLDVLETRLDADDGLHVRFLQVVQETALKAWNESRSSPDTPKLQWMYWCSRRHMDWHWMDRLDVESSLSDKQRQSWSQHMTPKLQDELYRQGALQGVTHSKLCVTPGITTGFAIGTREANVPVFAHDELVKKLQGDGGLDHNPQNAASVIPGCGLPSRADCLQFIETFVFEAIRSRTPTSAGMLNVHPPLNSLYDSWWVNYVFANMAHESFGISRASLAWINHYLSDHVIDIARDNLLGQCTTGHSCKESAKADLEKLIQSRAATAATKS
jgi:hypothetical protein